MTVEVSYYSPGNKLEWLVKQFQIIRFNGKTEVLDKFIPREDISLVFHFKTPPCMLHPEPGILPRFFLAPVIRQPNLMRIYRKNETFIITCKPSVFSRTFNISLESGRHIYKPLPDKMFFPLWQNLRSCLNIDERMTCFEKFMEKVSPKGYIPDDVDMLYNCIIEKGAHTPVYELIRMMPACERTIQRLFNKRVGVSPKTLVRIVRINFLWEKIRNNEPIDYQSLIFEGNYFDQTHFIKDFKAITGETPDYFFRRDLRNVRILSGKKD